METPVDVSDASGALSMRTVLPERFDALAVDGVRQEFDEALATGTRSIEVDLADVGFLDSAGLATLVRVMKELRARGGDLIIGRPAAPDVIRLLELTRFDVVFTLVDFADREI